MNRTTLAKARRTHRVARRSSRLCVHLFGFAILTLNVLRADELAAPTFSASTTGGRRCAGNLVELSKDWSLRLAARETTAITGKELVELRCVGARLPPPPREPHLLLAGGDRVLCVADSLRLEGEKLRCRPTRRDAKEWKLPLSGVTTIWFAAPDADDDVERLQRKLATGPRARDEVLLRNGDVIAGVLTELDAAKNLVKVEVEKRVVEAKLDRVAYIALNTELATPPKPKGPYARVVFNNGCRLSLVSATADAHTLLGRTLLEMPVQAPLAEIAALSVMQGSAVYLSDLKARQYEHTPYLSVRWPLVTDGSASRRDLRLAGNVYDKGLGMHSASRVTYDLPSNYQRFECLVGLDERTGRHGRVRVQVLVDGKESAARDLSGGGAPVAINIPVAGAKQLTLVVDYGGGGSVQDDVDWVDARLIK
jgi:hypothetical protein